MRITGARTERGFSLLELLIAVAMLGVLSAMALSSYSSSVAKTKRRAAEACLSNFATYMERFYTTNMRYDQDAAANAMNTAALTALGLDCASAAQTGSDYAYSFSTAPTQVAYTLQAAPSGAQATRDARCGSLRLDQAGNRTVTGTATDCW